MTLLAAPAGRRPRQRRGEARRRLARRGVELHQRPPLAGTARRGASTANDRSLGDKAVDFEGDPQAVIYRLQDGREDRDEKTGSVARLVTWTETAVLAWCRRRLGGPPSWRWRITAAAARGRRQPARPLGRRLLDVPPGGPPMQAPARRHPGRAARRLRRGAGGDPDVRGPAAAAPGAGRAACRARAAADGARAHRLRRGAGRERRAADRAGRHASMRGVVWQVPEADCYGQYPCVCRPGASPHPVPAGRTYAGAQSSDVENYPIEVADSGDRVAVTLSIQAPQPRAVPARPHQRLHLPVRDGQRPSLGRARHPRAEPQGLRARPPSPKRPHRAAPSRS